MKETLKKLISEYAISKILRTIADICHEREPMFVILKFENGKWQAETDKATGLIKGFNSLQDAIDALVEIRKTCDACLTVVIE